MDKVCVIGNGPNVMDNKLGEEINSFNEVVRFNRSPIKGYEEFIGNKTTYRFINRVVAFNSREDPNEDLSIVPSFRNMTIILDNDLKQVFKNNNGVFDKSCNFSFINRKQELKEMLGNYLPDIDIKERKPTGGLAIISYFLNKGYDVTIHGFGLSDNRNLKVIPHFYEDKNVKTTHDYNYEVDIIENLIYNKVINIL